jgi:hypothetical protein
MRTVPCKSVHAERFREQFRQLALSRIPSTLNQPTRSLASRAPTLLRGGPQTPTGQWGANARVADEPPSTWNAIK